MPINWTALEEGIDDALESAQKRTDDKLASLVSSVSRLTDEEVKKLFPTPADVEKLKKLLEIVKSADTRNKKITRLEENIEDLAGTVMKLLETFA